MITYRATNKKNGKWYVGSAVNLERRKKEHLKSKQKSPFHNALRKNPDIFIWEVLEEDNREDRLTEQLILDVWFGSEYCYNLSSSAGGFNTETAKKAASKNSRENLIKAGKVGGASGGRTTQILHPDLMKENGRKTLALLIEKNPNHQSDAGKIGGKLGSKEKKRVGGLRCKEEKLGMFSLTEEERTEVSQNVIKKVNSQRWVDPNHPELGEHSSGTLASMQKRRGLPHTKENRVQVY